MSICKKRIERDSANRRGQTDLTDASNPSMMATSAESLSKGNISHKNENVNKNFLTNSNNTKSGAWSQIDDIIESTIDDVLVQYGQGKAHSDVVTVLRNGKQEFWKINDPNLSMLNLTKRTELLWRNLLQMKPLQILHILLGSITIYHIRINLSTKTLNNSISAHDVGFYFYSHKNFPC